MLASERETVIERRIASAKTAAALNDLTYYVIEIDDGGEFGERSILLADQRYVDSDEYAAFDGQILHAVGPSGDVD